MLLFFIHYYYCMLCDDTLRGDFFLYVVKNSYLKISKKSFSNILHEIFKNLIENRKNFKIYSKIFYINYK